MERKGVREKEGEGEREVSAETERDRQEDRERGGSSTEAKGWFEVGRGLREWGDGNLAPFFYSFMKIGSGPVIIPTEWIYDRSALHVVTWWMENIQVYLGHGGNGPTIPQSINTFFFQQEKHLHSKLLSVNSNFLYFVFSFLPLGPSTPFLIV